MNYWSLKWLIETVVKTFKCPECNWEIDDTNIDIIWAAWNTVNIDIECKKCWKHSMIKSEVVTFDLAKLPASWELLNKIKWQINNSTTNSKDKITDEQIVKLNQNLKKRKINVEDLLSDKN